MPLTRTVNLQRQNNGGTNTTNLDPITYNSRYPWLDEYNYKKLESKVDNLGLSGYDKEKAMDEWYIQVLPLVQNNIKNSDRRKYINQARYEVSQIQDPDAKLQAKAKLSVTEISQLIKEKYNVDPSANDEEVFNSWINTIPNGGQLLADYMNGKSQDLLYEWWLKTKVVEEKPIDTTKWWIKGRIADAWSNTEEWWILPDTWELVNPIGYLTEILDTLWQKWADYITVWKGAREDLLKKINELSDEDLEQYRKRYKNSWYQWSFEDYIIDTNKTMWQDLVGADEELKGIAEPNVFKFFGNMPASTLRLVTASLKNVTNPLDVWKWLGKMFATEEWRDALYNRYLTAEWWANALNYDPVGTADEVLSVANSFGSLLKNTWKLTRLNWVENAWNWISNNVWSPFDVAVDRALNWWDITYGTNPDNMKTTNVKWLYGALDDTLGKQGKLWGAVNRYLQDTSSVWKLMENTKSDYEYLKENGADLKDKAVEWIANRLSGTKSAQDKLFQAQEPTLNRLSKGRSTKNIRNKADVANELIVKDIQQNGGELPTDVRTREAAHERAMKNKWAEIEDAIWNKGKYTIDTTQLADNLDAYIKSMEDLGITKDKWELWQLKEQSESLRNRGEVDLVTLEKMKERINADLNDRDDKSIWNVYKNWMTELTQDIGRIEDKIISEIPWQFQDLKNDFGALADGYGDVVKARVKVERAKYGDNLSNYSRIKGIWDTLKWVWHGDLWEIWKGVAQAVWWEVTAKLKDKNRLIEEWFKSLAEDMKNPEFKSAKKSLAGKPKWQSSTNLKQSKKTTSDINKIKSAWQK